MKTRKNYTPQEKVAILRAHLIDRVPASQICARFQLQSTILCKWLKQLFDNGAAALKRRPTIGKQPEAIQHRAADINAQVRPFESKEDELNWMISLAQGQFSAEQIKPAICAALGQQDIEKLLACIRDEPLKYRNRALAILSYYRLIRVGHIAEFLRVSASSVDEWSRRFAQHGCCALLPWESEYYKAKDKVYQDAVFEILHAPPSAHGINRTTWRQEDVHFLMAKRGLRIAKANIRKIIKDAGYVYRKAKKVLTSNDPDYDAKLKNITRILRNLGPKEKFFSIDEYGPFAIKIHGGRSLVPIGRPRSVPQYQRSKGKLIVTAALELSTNQITHFYSSAKNTAEMAKLLHRLVEAYANQECIYFSWDAASWHASKALQASVQEINIRGVGHPRVELVPLPSCAQFLNVIESVFSGMARAVIHNSNFPSVEAAQSAIDRYIAERNDHFAKDPKRAGQKIWGDERVPSEFAVSHNCKDPRYR